MVVTVFLLLNSLWMRIADADDTSIIGEGSLWPGKLYRDLAYAFNGQKDTGTGRAFYNDTSSAAGRLRLLDDKNTLAEGSTIDFAGTSGFGSGCPEGDQECEDALRFFPAVAGAVVPVFNLPGLNETVSFSRDALLNIFTGRTTKWNHDEITNKNKRIEQRLPDETIQVVVRYNPDDETASDTTTDIMAAALSSFDPRNLFEKFRLLDNGTPAWCVKNKNTDVGPAIIADGQVVTCRAREDDPSTWWSYIAVPTNEALLAVVEATPYSLGYADYSSLAMEIQQASDESQQFRVRGLMVADMQNARDRRVTASITTMQYAMMERGNEFKTSTTVSLVDAQGPNVWPITGYAYFAVRQHQNVSCARRRVLLDFMTFFYERASGEIPQAVGFAPLPEFLRKEQMENMRSITCENYELVAEFVPASSIDSSIVVPLVAYDLMKVYSDSYTVAQDLEFSSWPVVGVANSSTAVSNPEEVALSLTSFDVRRHDTNTYYDDSWKDNFFTAPLFAMGVAVVYRLDSVSSRVILDANTLAQIYLGHITTWSEISEDLPDTEIAVVSRVVDSDDVILFKRFLSDANPEFNNTYAHAEGLIAQRPYDEYEWTGEGTDGPADDYDHVDLDYLDDRTADNSTQKHNGSNTNSSKGNTTDDWNETVEEDLLAADAQGVFSIVRVRDGAIGFAPYDSRAEVAVADLNWNGENITLSQDTLYGCLCAGKHWRFEELTDSAAGTTILDTESVLTYSNDVDQDTNDGIAGSESMSSTADSSDESYTLCMNEDCPASCWPLTATYDVSIKRAFVQNKCNETEPPQERRLVEFAQWIMEMSPSPETFEQWTKSWGDVDDALRFRDFVTVPCGRKRFIDVLRLLCELDTSENERSRNEDKNFLDDWVLALVAALVAGVFLLVCSCIFFTCRYKKHLIVKLSQPIYLIILCCGCAISTVSCMSIFFEENDEGRSVSCHWQIFLYGFGFSVTTGALVTKMYSMEKSLSSSLKFRTVKPREARRELVKDAASVMGLMALGEVTILAAWALSAHPLEFKRSCHDRDHSVDEAVCVDSLGRCRSAYALPFLCVLFSYHVLCLGVGIWMCYRVRNIPSILAEGKWVFTAVYSQIQLHIIALPLLALVEKDYLAFTVIKTALICAGDTTVLLMIFVPKFQLIWKYGDFDRDKVVQYISNNLHLSTQNDHIYCSLRKSETNESTDSVLTNDPDRELKHGNRGSKVSDVASSEASSVKCHSMVACTSIYNKAMEDEGRSSSNDETDQASVNEKAALRSRYAAQYGRRTVEMREPDVEECGASPRLLSDPSRLSNATVDVEREETKTPVSSMDVENDPPFVEHVCSVQM